MCNYFYLKNTNIDYNKEKYGAGLEITLTFLGVTIGGKFGIGFDDGDNTANTNITVQVHTYNELALS